MPEALLPLRPFVNKSIPPGNTVTNTAVEKAFETKFTLPGGLLEVGDAMVVHTAGVFSCVAGSTLTARGQLGSAPVLSPPVLDLEAATNWGWTTRTTLLVLAAGVSGLVDVQATISYTVDDTGTSRTLNVGNANPVSIDLSRDQDYAVYVKWGAANVGNKITLHQIIGQMLRPLPPLLREGGKVYEARAGDSERAAVRESGGTVGGRREGPGDWGHGSAPRRGVHPDDPTGVAKGPKRR